MSLQKLKIVGEGILNFLLRRKIKTSHSAVYIKDKLTSKIIIEYSRLLIPYKINKEVESNLLIKIKDNLHNFVQVESCNNNFIFLEKRGLKYTASLECFCDVKDTYLIENRLKNFHLL